MKAIILARVSTEEQKEAGNSLPAQIHRLEAYCKRKDFEIIKRFSFDESAYKVKRDEFDKILEYLESNKAKIAVCFDKVDRLSRNVFDKRVGILYEKAVSDEIELHFVSENQVIGPSMSAVEKFQFGMSLGLAKYYSDAISDNVKRAFEQKRRSGTWTGKAPIGYKNIIDIKGVKDIIFDPDTAHLIRKIFELYATGNHSTKTVRIAIAKLGLKATSGLPLALSMIDHILNNPFYYGYMRSKGRLYPHKYQPLISKELFDECQRIRKGWNKKPFQYAAKPFILRGLLRCARCGCSMSPESHAGKPTYYSCTNAKKDLCSTKVYVPEKTLLEPIYGYLRAFSAMTQEKIDEVVNGLKITNGAENAYHQKAINALRSEYDEIQIKLGRLLDLFIAGSITKDDYDKKVKEFKEKQYDLNIQLEEHTKADESYYITAGTVLNLAKNALEIFESSDPLEKRTLLNYLLQNSTVDGKIPHYTLRKPFDSILILANQPTGLRR